LRLLRAPEATHRRPGAPRRSPPPAHRSPSARTSSPALNPSALVAVGGPGNAANSNPSSERRALPPAHVPVGTEILSGSAGHVAVTRRRSAPRGAVPDVSRLRSPLPDDHRGDNDLGRPPKANPRAVTASARPPFHDHGSVNGWIRARAREEPRRRPRRRPLPVLPVEL